MLNNLFFLLSLFALYDNVQDIKHPTVEEYKYVQDYIHGRRDVDETIAYANYIWIYNNFKMVGEKPEEIPETGICHVNGGGDNCVILYASYNMAYIRGLRWLVDYIQNSDYQGDILYKIGGWPDLEGGSFVLAHVPYAFKVCFFKEAQSLGYKRVLWLDTSIIPLISLNDAFQWIEENETLIVGNDHAVGPYFTNRKSAAYFGLTAEDTFTIPSCSSGIFGVDLSTPKGRELIDWWYRAAQDPHAFYNPRPDQSVLSLILFKMGIGNWIDYHQIPHRDEDIKPDSLFLVDKDYVHKHG